MREGSGTRFCAHAPGCKREAHCSIGHVNKDNATLRNRCHIRTLRDDHVQSTKRLMTTPPPPLSPTRGRSRRDLPDLNTSIFLSPRLNPQPRLTRSMDMLANCVTATKTKANFVSHTLLSPDENDLLRELGVEAKLGILRAQRKNINRSIIRRNGGPVYDGVLLAGVIHW